MLATRSGGRPATHPRDRRWSTADSRRVRDRGRVRGAAIARGIECGHDTTLPAFGSGGRGGRRRLGASIENETAHFAIEAAEFLGCGCGGSLVDDASPVGERLREMLRRDTGSQAQERPLLQLSNQFGEFALEELGHIDDDVHASPEDLGVQLDEVARGIPVVLPTPLRHRVIARDASSLLLK